MQYAQHGDTVKVDYVGMLDNGAVFESTFEKLPLQFTLGNGEVIPGIDEAVVGMSPGEEKTLRIPAQKAFGFPRKDMAVVVDRRQVPDRVTPMKGNSVVIRSENDQEIVATVTDISDSTITLDMNHPLAGQDLTVALKLIDIVESAQESV